MMRGISNFHSRKWRHTNSLTMSSVAQWLERLLYIWKVGSSIPGVGTCAGRHCNEIHLISTRYGKFIGILSIFINLNTIGAKKNSHRPLLSRWGSRLNWGRLGRQAGKLQEEAWLTAFDWHGQLRSLHTSTLARLWELPSIHTLLRLCTETERERERERERDEGKWMCDWTMSMLLSITKLMNWNCAMMRETDE